jgi:hypothetical protein
MTRKKKKDVPLWYVYINGRLQHHEGKQGWWDFNLSTVIGMWAADNIHSKDPISSVELKCEVRDGPLPVRP